MKPMTKTLGLIVLVLMIAVLGAYGWAVKASDERLAKTWPDVVGKTLEVPFPLTADEMAVLESKLKAAGTDYAGIPLKPVVKEDGTEMLPGPFANASPEAMKALYLEHAKARGEHLYTVRLACKECHGADLGGRLIVDAQPVWTWYAPNISKRGCDQGIHHSVLG